MQKDGKTLTEPAHPKSLLELLASLPTKDEDFPIIPDLPAGPVDF